MVTIASFAYQLDVIASKQRPRKLTIHGSDGEVYAFLLKGHEDLRQDERVMQVFSAFFSIAFLVFHLHASWWFYGSCAGVWRITLLLLSLNKTIIYYFTSFHLLRSNILDGQILSAFWLSEHSARELWKNCRERSVYWAIFCHTTVSKQWFDWMGP